MSNKETLQEYNERLGTNNITLDSILETINKLPEAGEGGTPEIKPRYIHLIKDGVEQVGNTGGIQIRVTTGSAAQGQMFNGDGYLGLGAQIWSDVEFNIPNKFDLTEYTIAVVEWAYPKASSPYARQNAVAKLEINPYQSDNKENVLLTSNGATVARRRDTYIITKATGDDSIAFHLSNTFDTSSETPVTAYPVQIFNLYLENPNATVQDKIVEINENGTTIVSPDEGYAALNSVEINVEVESNLQDKDVEINENGVTTVTADEGFDGLNSVEIVTNVSSSGDATIGDGLISGTLSEYASDNLTSIREYAFYYNSNIAAITTPNVKSISKYAFYKTTYLQTITIPSVTSIREQAFYNSAVKEINVPVLTTLGDKAFYGCSLLTTFNAPLIETLGSNAFQNCSKLQTVHIPNIKSISHYCFSNCSKLASIDLHNCTEINHYAFQSCNALAALILRSSTLCTLGVYVFSSTSPIALGTGYIYVPSALLEDYKTATNWSDYASQFKSIEELPDTDV